MGQEVFSGCDQLLATTVNLDDEHDQCLFVVLHQLMQRHANLPFHRACSSTTDVNPQTIQVCFQVHGIEPASMEVDDQEMTALHILCLNPHVTGDWNDSITFVEDGNFSSWLAWWYSCMP